MALALDGSAHNSATASSLTVTLSTSSAGDVIILCVTSNGGPVTSVTSANLSWAFVATDSVGPDHPIDMWYAIAAGALSSEVITVNNTSSDLTTIDAFGISGANTSSPFDGAAVTGHPDPLSISTTLADTFIIGAFRQTLETSPTAGAGWTAVSGADYQLVEYKIVASAQVGLSVTQTTGSGFVSGGIAQAIKIASASGRTAMYIPGPQGPMVI